jgi:hypothetical protein
MMKSVKQGAATTVYAAVHAGANGDSYPHPNPNPNLNPNPNPNPNPIESGMYFEDCNVTPLRTDKARELVADTQIRRMLWERSEALVNSGGLECSMKY